MLTDTTIMDDIYILADVQIQKKIDEKIEATGLKQNITQDRIYTTPLANQGRTVREPVYCIQ